jgi:hypothetical protein
MAILHISRSMNDGSTRNAQRTASWLCASNPGSAGIVDLVQEPFMTDFSLN